MHNLSEIELAWMAGFVDGEGCIMLGYSHNEKTGNYNFRRRVNIVNTNRDILKIFQDNFGGSIREQKHMRKHFPNAKPIYSWVCDAKQGAYFIGLIKPYLKVKACQADLYLQYDYWLNNFPVYGRRVGKAADKSKEAKQSIDARIYLVDTMHKLNKRGIASGVL